MSKFPFCLTLHRFIMMEMQIDEGVFPLAIPHIDTLDKIPAPLLAWYKNAARPLPWREEVSPYRVWISEIMLQQTRVAAVIPYFERFLAALPDAAALAAVPEDTLMKLWQWLGYYTRARNLRRAAEKIVKDYGGEMPTDFAALLALPGIGRYTAAAVSSIAGGAPVPAVDGNVMRIVTRFTCCPDDIGKEKTRREIETALRPLYRAGRTAGALNSAFMELGQTVCLPHGAPHCAACPLAADCLAHAEDCTADFPKKSAKKKRRTERLTVLRLLSGGRLALKKRPETGLLAGLYELPHLAGHQTKNEVRQSLAARGFTIERITRLPAARHVFTHVVWDMTGYEVLLAPPGAERASKDTSLVWADAAALASRYSVPTAFSYYLR